jgi:hypothetical protein
MPRDYKNQIAVLVKHYDHGTTTKIVEALRNTEASKFTRVRARMIQAIVRSRKIKGVDKNRLHETLKG